MMTTRILVLLIAILVAFGGGTDVLAGNMDFNGSLTGMVEYTEDGPHLSPGFTLGAAYRPDMAEGPSNILIWVDEVMPQDGPDYTFGGIGYTVIHDWEGVNLTPEFAGIIGDLGNTEVLTGWYIGCRANMRINGMPFEARIGGGEIEHATIIFKLGFVAE